MNTRTPIQPSNTPAVLSISFSVTGNRFLVGLSDGIRCLRTDNCFTTYHPALPVSDAHISDGGYAVAAQLDDRYLVLVGGGRNPAGKASVVTFWDALMGVEVSKFDFREAVKGVRVGRKWMVVVLDERAIVFEYQNLKSNPLLTPPPDDSHQAKEDAAQQATESQHLRGPNVPKALFPTATNPFALASLQGDTLALPAQSIGQVQLIPLNGGSKRVLRAHNSTLRNLTLNCNASQLATASEQGTLIRIFDAKTTDQLFEFRRGVDHAVILSLAFSPGGRWLASTSDKGTLHIFDCRPPDAATLAAQAEKAALERRQSHRKSQSTNYAAHRLSGGVAAEATSSLSGGGRSSPASIAPSAPGTFYQGSVQEYYGLRPVPSSASPPALSGPGVSAMAALKSSPWAPKVFKDVRSVASAGFSMGDDVPYWQGGASSSWTMAPDGTRKRIRHAVPPLPNDPSGRPPKGVLCIKQRDGGGGDEEGVVLYVVGGGSDARWEKFELAPTEGGGWALVFQGFRKYLQRQFV